MRGMVKHFGAVKALDRVTFEVMPSEVHALVGENGAGKSTLMKLLSGAYKPDSGEMWLGGARYRPQGPSDARRHGVAMIYQELNLAPRLSIEENIMLGRERQRFGFVLKRAMRRQIEKALEGLDLPQLDLQQKVEQLGPGDRQLVEIARAVVGEARIVVMDEPTSSLSREDAERLFAVIRKLRDQGVSIVYISHFLEEVKRVADRYTVLRDGCAVGTGLISSTRTEQIIEQMVGRKVDTIFPRVEHQRGQVVLELRAIGLQRPALSASLSLHRGEIFGIAGLIGSGRTQLLRAIFGLREISTGEVRVGGLFDKGLTPWARWRQGIGFLSEDRKDEGLALELSVAVNLTLSRLSPYATHGWVNVRKQRSIARDWIDRLAIRCLDPRQKAGDLSGGNQQKVALARLLYHDVDILLLDEPTRGIDVGSKAEIYLLIGKLAAQGKAVLFISSYLPELLGVCDRIAVMHRGRLGRARPAAEWTEASLLDEATRGLAERKV
ncbi:MAG: sugar ABC transporter ATP-binding protein [Deltaproteobacteria bacterium]|nr:sugar ABC transporter ATP-binding protein [Deltaproteobacteria bacterium]